MTRVRGICYEAYEGKCICTKCQNKGYLERWKSYLSNSYRVFSVRHVEQRGDKGYRHQATKARCWLGPFPPELLESPKVSDVPILVRVSSA